MADEAVPAAQEVATVSASAKGLIAEDKQLSPPPKPPKDTTRKFRHRHSSGAKKAATPARKRASVDNGSVRSIVQANKKNLPKRSSTLTTGTSSLRHKMRQGEIPVHPCMVAECVRNAAAQGYCLLHYNQYVLTKPATEVLLEQKPLQPRDFTSTPELMTRRPPRRRSLMELSQAALAKTKREHKDKPRSKQHKAMGIKKFLASKSAKYATTRNFMGQTEFLGIAGDRLLTILKTVTAALSGKAMAKAYREILFKCVAKWKLLLEDKKVSIQVPEYLKCLARVRGSLEEALDKVLRMEMGPRGDAAMVNSNLSEEDEQLRLAAVAALPKDSNGVDASVHTRRALLGLFDLSEHLQELSVLTVDMLRIFLQPKNVNKLIICLKYYSGIDFMTFFMAPRWRAEQQLFQEALLLMLRDLVPPLCIREKCYRPRLEAQGDFRGSQYCSAHHNELLHSPSLWFFLPGNSGFPSFRTYCTEHDLSNMFFLHREIVNYRNARRRAIRLQQVRFIFATFLFHDATRFHELDRTLLTPIQKAVQDESFYPSPALFRPVEHALMEQIKDAYSEFQKSDMYQSHACEFELPFSLLQDLEMERREEQQANEHRKVKFDTIPEHIDDGAFYYVGEDIEEDTDDSLFADDSTDGVPSDHYTAETASDDEAHDVHRAHLDPKDEFT